MATEEAVALKNEGNKAFAAHDWPTAIDFYTKAINIDSKQPAYYSNRAQEQAYIRSEAYGYAIADATKAVELDPNFVKAYYRRGVAYAAILRPKDALKDLQIVVKKAPGDKDAKLKLVEAQRIVKRDAFERAIEVGEEPSAAEGLDLDSMAVDADYDGVRLEKEMTQEFITDMIERFKNGKKIPKKYVYQIVIAVKNISYDEATMVEMEIPDDATMT
ncbi:Serine/threonine-protein phosphatase T, partial [Lachnellula willkommii]